MKGITQHLDVFELWNAGNDIYFVYINFQLGQNQNLLHRTKNENIIMFGKYDNQK
jgi:hypothetical protein